MNPTFLLCLGFGLLVVAQAYPSERVERLCPTCGLGDGENACGCNQVVVRPPKPVRIVPAQPKVVCHKVAGASKLEPVGDVCSCGKSFVQPADMPRVSHCPSCRQQPRYVIEEEEPRCVHYAKGPAPHAAPVDAVSLHLAYGLAQQAGVHVREESLAFGPRVKPLDGVFQKQVRDIPEEQLYSFDKQIVELKLRPRYGCARAALEAEAEETLHEAEVEDVAIHHHLPRLPTYSDVGYLPETRRHQDFIIHREGEIIGDDAVEISETYAYDVPQRPVSGALIISEKLSDDEGQEEEQIGLEDEEEIDVTVVEAEPSHYAVLATSPKAKPCGRFLKKLGYSY